MGSEYGMTDAPRRVARKRATTKKAARPAPRSVETPPARDPWGGSLDTGDTVEISATVEVADKRNKRYWPRVGVVTKVREGETPSQAVARAGAFVHEVLGQQAADWIND